MKQEKFIFNVCASTLQEGSFGTFSLLSHSYYNSHFADNFDKKQKKQVGFANRLMNAQQVIADHWTLIILFPHIFDGDINVFCSISVFKLNPTLKYGFVSKSMYLH